MKYSLRTLLIAAILGPALFVGMYYLLPRTYNDFAGFRRYAWDDDQKRILFVVAVILALAGLGLLFHFSRSKQL